ncbi:hypothetical protein IC006_0348 [Sulfuracidifex tepidarius]|uniref:Uncharacterized protein n=1 Tax=Sulfuracidifex tepidarius TaxID=1294262 RepID=A0A510DSC7_9CREN|nr:hypothetical protein [Sulfuracidifex tepidarius]BBG23064.1 hypothetical protein IC006_0348 [Sulfuracidifex tepidarius]
MNIKMWGPILAGAVVIAIGILLLVGYGFSFMNHPTAFAFSYAGADYLGMSLNVVGLALVMIGGVFKK